MIYLGFWQAAAPSAVVEASPEVWSWSWRTQYKEGKVQKKHKKNPASDGFSLAKDEEKLPVEIYDKYAHQ